MATFQTSVDPIPLARSRRIDLLRWPGLGRFLRWRHARLALQVPLLILAGFAIFDGLVGPSLAPKNLATVTVWLHYRGLVALALLVAGNLFCMACPFMLPRRGGRWLREHLLRGGRPVPRALRSKWLTVGLLLVFFYTYEQFSLWASPWLTAWVAIGYFLAAFLVDTMFQGAAFCKYVCPLGQFNFFGSLMSPLEVKVREPQVCAACHTKDCIAALPGRVPATEPAQWMAPADGARLAALDPEVHGAAPAAAWTWQRGCELWLFQPAKAGNMDCTFCLDCVHACPHDNVGLIARMPTQELWTDPFRSGIGRFSRRLDLVALVVLLVFGGFINAFSMIRPVYALRDRLAVALGLGSALPVLVLTFIGGLIVLPVLLLGLAGLATRWLSGEHRVSVVSLVQRYAFALVPLGFGMWVAHYSFHFLTGGLTIVPVVQSFLADVGLYSGRVQWELAPLVPADWLFPIEAVFLYYGTFASLLVVFQIARRPLENGNVPSRNQVLRAFLPWAALILLMLAFGLWVMLQPMDMRGTIMMLGLPGG